MTFDNKSKVLNFIKSFFIDVDLDACEFILYFFSSCINDNYKKNNFLILTGDGNNGKSTFIQLFMTVIPISDKRDIKYLTEPFLLNPVIFENMNLIEYNNIDSNVELNINNIKELSKGIIKKKIIKYNINTNTNYIISSKYNIKIKNSFLYNNIYKYKFKKIFESDNNIIDDFMSDKNMINALKEILIEYNKKLNELYNGNIKNIYTPTIMYESYKN